VNRITWDSTAPRRLGRKQGERRRTDDSLVEAEAELIRPALAKLHRVWPFS
jgi:hypothetical protein